MVHAEALQRLAHLTDALGRLARIRARRADDRAAVEVDAGRVVDFEVDHVLGVALGEPFEAVVAAEHPQAVVARLDGGGRDDRVDPGRRSPADQDRERLLGVHRTSPRAATGHTASTMPLRTPYTSSTMLLTTQQWFGTTSTTSPTAGRSRHAERSTTPCSSDRPTTAAFG